MSFPIGSIIMWYKPIAERPAGWELCDGTNNTPDLQDKFVKGAAADGDRGAVPGSSATHVHANQNAAGADDHNHSVPVTLSGVSGGNYGSYGGSYVAAGQSHQHTYTGGSSNSGTHQHTIPNTNNGDSLPPFVQIYFIMKVAV